MEKEKRKWQRGWQKSESGASKKKGAHRKAGGCDMGRGDSRSIGLASRRRTCGQVTRGHCGAHPSRLAGLPGFGRIPGAAEEYSDRESSQCLPEASKLRGVRDSEAAGHMLESRHHAASQEEVYVQTKEH